MNSEKIIKVINDHLTNDNVKKLESTITTYADLLRYEHVVNASLNKLVKEPKLESK